MTEHGKNVVRGSRRSTSPGGRGGSSEVEPLMRQCPPEEIELQKHAVSLASCSFLAPRFGDLLAVHVLGTDFYPLSSNHSGREFIGPSDFLIELFINMHKNRRCIVRESYESFPF